MVGRQERAQHFLGVIRMPVRLPSAFDDPKSFRSFPLQPIRYHITRNQDTGGLWGTVQRLGVLKPQCMGRGTITWRFLFFKRPFAPRLTDVDPLEAPSAKES